MKLRSITMEGGSISYIDHTTEFEFARQSIGTTGGRSSERGARPRTLSAYAPCPRLGPSFTARSLVCIN